MRPLLALALAALLAGCLGPAQPVDPAGLDPLAAVWRFTDFIVDDHEHNDQALHTFASPTMAELAHVPLGEDGAPYSYIGEIDTRANLSAVAIVARGSAPGFQLLDTTDPAQPQRLGRAEAPWAYGADVKLTADGAFALLASQGPGTGGPVVPTDPTALAGPFLERSSIGVYDLADPLQPSLVHVAPVAPTGCHMITIGEVQGQEYVWCINAALTTLRFDRAPVPTLTPVAVYFPFGPDVPPTVVEKSLGVLPHDATFQLDPLDGTPLVVVSHWDLGVAVLDVTDPLAPRELFRWAGEGAQEYHGYVHSAQLAKVGERRVLIATPETLSDVLPAIWLLDVTDWTQGALAAEWWNPGKHTSQGLLMTTHQWQVVGERLYLAYNHNGVWVLDLPTILANKGGAPDAAEILGVFQPHDAIDVFDPDLAVLPNVWDVNVVGGRILATDRYTGLHVLRYAGDPLAGEITSSA
ncbi:MAG TPA: hypothetical protein VGR28_09830 [Candidatus Thermoplasmatota archaeon]|jgi:hypothetical protein|nr:hypothetical protein [Candidatus Thermoplasmatota archaeon]